MNWMAFEKLAEKIKIRSSFWDCSGQAMVEYTLMLIVSVAFIIGLGTQLFKPMQTFLKAYMGDYVSCLMETGELPSLGDSDAANNLQDMGCNARFEPATLANGRPPTSASSKSDSSSSSSTSSSSDAKSASKSDGSDGADKTGGSGGGGSGSSSATGAVAPHFKSGSRGTETGGANPEKVTEVPLSEEQQSSFYNRQGSWGSESVGRSSKAVAVGIAGVMEEEKRKQQRLENSSRIIASGETLTGPPKKIAIKKPEKKTVEAPEEPMTFGDFFKFLLIAAIIIAIFVVLGSQALKIAKSDE
jgi:hypothetical protein